MSIFVSYWQCELINNKWIG